MDHKIWPQELPAPISDANPSLPGFSFKERTFLGKLVNPLGQLEVMQQTKLFDRVIERQNAAKTDAKPNLTVAVFNMERGQTLPETLLFAKSQPMFENFDVILANELDDGCARSYNCDVSATFAKTLGLNDAFGLEFIELVNSEDLKGFHGNSIFSRLPIKASKVVRLPEEYNWFNDAKQHRVGGRLAILATIETPLGEITVVSTHFENRTDSEGRGRQMQVLLDEIESFSPEHSPVILGGDFNTNGYDGRDYSAAAKMLQLQKKGASLQSFYEKELVFSLVDKYGYQWREASEPEWPTRRAHFSEEVYDDKSSETLVLHIDWLFSKHLKIVDFGMISTVLPNQNPGQTKELSDHNIIWATYALK